MGLYRRTACPATDDIARRAPSGLTARTTARDPTRPSHSSDSGEPVGGWSAWHAGGAFFGTLPPPPEHPVSLPGRNRESERR